MPAIRRSDLKATSILKDLDNADSTDETLMHQGPVTFDQALTSDHRFFDRIWLGVHHEGEAALMMGMAVYKNMNVMEGFASLQKGDKQYNLRLSRILRPNMADGLEIGPLHVDILEPLQKLHIRLDPGEAYQTSFDLIWEGMYPAREEGHHFSRRRGRIYQDYIRFDQVGKANGWLSVGGEEIEAREWCGFRDHSWGVRPGVGGFEPKTAGKKGSKLGASTATIRRDTLFIWLAFRAEGVGGQFQMMEDGDGNRLNIDGHISFPEGSGKPELKVVDLDHDISFIFGTRVCDKATLMVTTHDGANWEIKAEAVGRAWVYKGTGYDDGYDDELGLGAYRGEDVMEVDVYDISHPEDVVLQDGRVIRPVHREQPVTLTVNGKPGYGHMSIINSGVIKRYGLE